MFITEKNYVDEAEKVIRMLSSKKNPRNGRPVPMVTTSKIRNILAMAADIYNEILLLQEDELGQELEGRIDYLRVRCVYEYGRGGGDVKDFIKEAKLLELLKEIGGSRKNYLLFHRYMESLVAFHRYYNGKE